MAQAQKHFSPKVKGSKRKQKAKLKLARIPSNIANKRKEYEKQHVIIELKHKEITLQQDEIQRLNYWKRPLKHNNSIC